MALYVMQINGIGPSGSLETAYEADDDMAALDLAAMTGTAIALPVGVVVYRMEGDHRTRIGGCEGAPREVWDIPAD